MRQMAPRFRRRCRQRRRKTAAAGSSLLSEQFGDQLLTLMTALKANEWERFSKAPEGPLVNGVSGWEQREYFRAY
jgi:hypothetical protein